MIATGCGVGRTTTRLRLPMVRCDWKTGSAFFSIGLTNRRRPVNSVLEPSRLLTMDDERLGVLRAEVASVVAPT
jgi:hypothetical protein